MIDHYIENGLTSRERKSGGRACNTKRLSFEDAQKTKTFITNYANTHALVLPGRVAGRKDSGVALLPSPHMKVVVYKAYTEAQQETGKDSKSKKSISHLLPRSVPSTRPWWMIPSQPAKSWASRICSRALPAANRFPCTTASISHSKCTCRVTLCSQDQTISWFPEVWIVCPYQGCWTEAEIKLPDAASQEETPLLRPTQQKLPKLPECIIYSPTENYRYLSGDLNHYHGNWRFPISSIMS
ncbi:hypothetical protein CAPTEDRAFT_200499 [Capitella teleta]|uniref:Uncharacterized protein n=1 Tax=Capitella teleta TaxID=283909 RepID=R7ULW5_CAPTE|nr:hypothetical protein CAPTEDRAFT_200499 [Capitella teleta]|eukprot:ELU04932.1 hypothetical protein CAPTEDRAFT_200499 [Capitella teleta]